MESDQRENRPRSLDSLLKLKPKPKSTSPQGISFADIRKLGSSNKSSKICLHLPIEELVSTGTTSLSVSLPISVVDTQRGDDGTVTSRMMTSRTNYTLESSKSSFILRVSMSGGVVVAGPVARVAIDGLGLQQAELRFLRTTFDEIDKDKDGRIDKFEFLHQLGETEQNSFTERVYQHIQLNWHHDNGINFDEFIHMSGTFCMFTTTDMTRFVFRCYNKHGDGMFGMHDFHDLSRAVTPNNGPKSWADALKFDRTHKSYLNEDDFITMEEAHPQLLDFARRMQVKLQEISLGTAFYTNVMQCQEHVRTRETRARMMNESLLSSGLLLPDDFMSGTDTLPLSLSLSTPSLPLSLSLSTPSDFTGDPDITKRDNRNLLKLGYKLLTNSV